MAKFGKKPTLGEMLLQHFIVFIICIVFPGIVTAVAPATWITFQRTEKSVDCTARTCVFFVVPYQTQRVAGVQAITYHVDAGRTERKRKFGRTTDETVHVDGQGFLGMQGREEDQIEVSVSPASIESVAAKANKFLDSPDETSRTLFVISNWKFGAIMGGVLTSFTALWILGYTVSLLKFLFNLFRPKWNGDATA